MSTYQTPIRDILFAAEHLVDLNGVASLPGHEDVTIEFALETIQPHRQQLKQNICRQAPYLEPPVQNRNKKL